uniref:Uncharacterized protein n=1 Tax=Tetradesmus obliquus TaxID=3088 RepID=A0A383VZ32_TETOB|eukprot:jgi/Sobl393_1/11927/SZX70102.1
MRLALRLLAGNNRALSCKLLAGCLAPALAAALLVNARSNITDSAAAELLCSVGAEVQQLQLLLLTLAVKMRCNEQHRIFSSYRQLRQQRQPHPSLDPARHRHLLAMLRDCGLSEQQAAAAPFSEGPAALMLLEAAHNLWQADAPLASEAASAALSCMQSLSLWMPAADGNSSSSSSSKSEGSRGGVGVMGAGTSPAAHTAATAAAAAADRVVAGSSGGSSSSNDGAGEDFNMAEVLQLVRKMMVKLDQQQQQQQQQAADEEHLDRLLEALIQILHFSAVISSNMQSDDAWRQLARPMAAMLEHLLHVRLVHQKADLGAESIANLWSAAGSLLWGGAALYGPLLLVAAEETSSAAAAAAAGAIEPAQLAAAADPLPGTSASAAATASSSAAVCCALQLFSLCVTALKEVQLTAAAMLTGAPPAAELSGGQHRSVSSAAAGVPWAVLLLRCVQLGMDWLQRTSHRLLAAAAGSSSATAGRMQQQQQQAWGSTVHQGLIYKAVVSLGQLYNGLDVLELVFGSWCTTAAGAAAAGEPAAMLPLLQQCQQQLQTELLPAVQQVVGLWELRNSSRHRGQQQQSIRDVVRSCGMLSRTHSSLMKQSFKYFSTGNWSYTENAEDAPKTHVLIRLVKRAAQGIWGSTPEQQQAAVQALQQLLASGKLQAWVAAASAALVLQQPRLQQPGHSRQQGARQ